MACHCFGTKPLPEQWWIIVNWPSGTNFNESEIPMKISAFLLKNPLENGVCKWRPFYPDLYMLFDKSQGASFHLHDRAILDIIKHTKYPCYSFPSEQNVKTWVSMYILKRTLGCNYFFASCNYWQTILVKTLQQCGFPEITSSSSKLYFEQSMQKCSLN